FRLVETEERLRGRIEQSLDETHARRCRRGTQLATVHEFVLDRGGLMKHNIADGGELLEKIARTRDRDALSLAKPFQLGKPCELPETEEFLKSRIADTLGRGDVTRDFGSGVAVAVQFLRVVDDPLPPHRLQHESR